MGLFSRIVQFGEIRRIYYREPGIVRITYENPLPTESLCYIIYWEKFWREEKLTQLAQYRDVS